MDNIQLSDIQGNVKLADVKLSSLSLSADAVVGTINKVIDEVNSKGTDISVDTDLRTDSANPIANAPVAFALNSKMPISYETLAKSPEFHAICPNLDGSIFVLGGAEDGATAGALMVSDDKLKTVVKTPVTVYDANAVIPECSAVYNNYNTNFYSTSPFTTYVQWRAIAYSKKANKFVAAPVTLSYYDKSKVLKRAVVIWSSSDGKHWECQCLSTYVDNNVSQCTMKIAYDDSTGLTLLPHKDKVFYTEDCATWDSYTIQNDTDTEYFNGTAIDVMTDGEYLVWSGAHYNAAQQGACVVKYDKETKTFSNEAVLRLTAAEQTSLGNKCLVAMHTAFANGVGIADAIGIYNNPFGLCQYDAAEKKLSLNTAYKSTNAQEIRGCFAYGNSIYFLTRTPKGMVKIDTEAGTLTQVYTSTFKLEQGCVLDDKVYIAGRDDYGQLFSFDPETNVLTQLSYNGETMVQYVKKSRVSTLKSITASDTATLSSAINSIIAAFNALKS